MTKHDDDKDRRSSAPAAMPGVVNLLESSDHPLTDGVAGFCRKVSDTIYQCLTKNGCRYKFTYETIHLCAWPSAGNAERTPANLPCHSRNGSEPTKG